MIIDAHQHYWQLDRGDYGWLTPDITPLYRDFLPEDLDAELVRHQVTATIVVQAAPTEEETRYLLELARQHASIRGVIGWVDMDAPDAVQRLTALRKDSEGLLKGIRPMIQDITDPDWVLSSHLDPVFDAISELGLVFEALVRPEHLSNLHERLLRHPALACVLNHGGKPNIEGRHRDPWLFDLTKLSELDTVFCKLSGLVTEAGDDWTSDDIQPFIEDIISTFGTDKTLWGSDWPVLTLATSYTNWLATAQEACQSLTTLEREKIFSRTAAQLYGLHI